METKVVKRREKIYHYLIEHKRIFTGSEDGGEGVRFQYSERKKKEWKIPENLQSQLWFFQSFLYVSVGSGQQAG